MSLLQFSGLFVVWLLCTLFIATLTGLSFAACGLTSISSFHCFFADVFLRISADQRTGIPL